MLLMCDARLQGFGSLSPLSIIIAVDGGGDDDKTMD